MLIFVLILVLTLMLTFVLILMLILVLTLTRANTHSCKNFRRWAVTTMRTASSAPAVPTYTRLSSTCRTELWATEPFRSLRFWRPLLFSKLRGGACSPDQGQSLLLVLIKFSDFLASDLLNAPTTTITTASITIAMTENRYFVPQNCQGTVPQTASWSSPPN